MHVLNPLHAVSIGKPFGGSIAAAMADRSYGPISHLMASTGLDVALTNNGRITLAEVDRALEAAKLPSIRRIELKATLSRLGLL